MLGKVQIWSLLLLLVFTESMAQTCCSGGVPLAGNLGMPSAGRGSLQFNLSYDHNRLTTLLEGDSRLEENPRSRLTQSLLFETAYSLTDRIYLSGLFTYVFQQRNVENPFSSSTDRIHGPGDAVLLLTYRLGGSALQNWELLLGAGPKIPTGRSDISNPSGILYSADLQPGSGAWDAVAWGMASRSGIIRPSAKLSARFTYRLTGVNPDYLGSNTYRFGNEAQLIAGISDSFLLGSLVLDPSLQVRYRHTAADISNGFPLPNTGGNWLYLVPGVIYQLTPDLHMGFSGELPIYANLDGIQLSTDFRFLAGIYMRLTRDGKNISFRNL